MAVFSLQEVKKLQVQNVTDNNFASWTESATRGYYVGGTDPTIATIARLDFTNETVSDPGNDLPFAKEHITAVSDGASVTRANGYGTYGYYAAGYQAPGPNVAVVDRLDITNYTTSALSVSLSSATAYLAATSSNSYGYFGGGNFATIDRLDFTNESMSGPGNNLPVGRSGLTAVSSFSYGYYGGGRVNPVSPPIVATVDRIDFSNETISAPGNNLPLAREFLAGTSNNSYGYFCGGDEAPHTDINAVATIDRIDFSNETTSAPGNNLPGARYSTAATSGNSYGYIAGGYQSSFPNVLATIDRLDYSNETLSSPGNNLASATRQVASTANDHFGFFGGGLSSPPFTYYSKIERITFSNETLSTLSETLSVGRYGLAGVTNSN